MTENQMYELRASIWLVGLLAASPSSGPWTILCLFVGAMFNFVLAIKTKP